MGQGSNRHGSNGAAGTPGALETWRLGPHTYTVTAKSKDGETSTESISYTVEVTPPEFGRCVKVPSRKVGGKTVYHGGFLTATCVFESGSHTGPYEWEPGVLKLTSDQTQRTYEITLQTVKGSKVICTGETSRGEFTGLKTVGGVVLTLTGCELASPEGDMREHGRRARRNRDETARRRAGHRHARRNRRKEQDRPRPLPRWKNGAAHGIQLRERDRLGAGLGYRAGRRANKMLLTATVKASAATGKQKPESFVGGPKDILEESFKGGGFNRPGLTLTTTQTNEEAVEVNSVV